MRKRGRPPKNNPLDVQDDVFVKAEVIKNLFDPPLSNTALHRHVHNGKVIKHSHGLYRLNASRKALGLPESDVREYRRNQRPSKLDLTMIALYSVREEVLDLYTEESELPDPDRFFFDEVEYMRKMVHAHRENIKDLSVEELAAYINGIRQFIKGNNGS
ncbi:MAG: hypothetical protein JJT75_10945 [Opitutales bacterium]|nr:hypothetical protein [Opitutales bacterium]MCH8539786.1 hypothetical protein [Opitutales bacterium]